MRVSYSKVTLDAQAVAAGCVLVYVLALNMKGLRFLVRDLGLEVPPVAALILLCNLQAAASGKGTAWVQT